MTKSDWVVHFVIELQRLRPHTPNRLAFTIAGTQYKAGVDPKKAAAAYVKALPKP